MEKKQEDKRIVIKANKQKLKDVISGFELDVLGKTTFATRKLITGDSVSEDDGEVRFVCDFYLNRPTNVFGGIISPGDAVFINEFIRKIRPQTVLEFGVASGFSSAFILCSMRRHGLLVDNGKGLISFDILEQHSTDRVVGCVMFKDYSNITEQWTLHTKKTSIDLFYNKNTFDIDYNGQILGFIDAGHNHPWPLIDLFVLLNIMSPGSWILMQDISLVERLVIDSLRLNCVPNKGYRGVQIAFEHWSGRKMRGLDGCYNMGAVQVPEGKNIVIGALKHALIYPFEKELDQNTLNFLKLYFETTDPASRLSQTEFNGVGA